MERYKQLKESNLDNIVLNKRYSPLLFKEAFKSGSHKKVLTLMAKIFNNRIKSQIKFDFDIPQAYVVSGVGKIVSYTGYFKDESMLYLNFLLSDSDYVHSFYFVDKNLNPKEAYEFEPETNIIQVITTIVEYVNGNLEIDDDEEEDSSPQSESIVHKTKNWFKETINEERQKIFQMWLVQSADRKEHMGSLSKDNPKKMYKDFVLSMQKEFPETVSSKFFPDSGQFIKLVRVYTKSNGISNPNIKFRAVRKVKKPAELTPILMPEEKPVAKAVMAEPAKMMITWRESFEDLQENVDLMLKNKKFAPYGLIVWGPGGTGKSYYINKVVDKLGGDKAFIYKGTPSLSEFIKILYDHKDFELIVFDDADKVVTDATARNILKGALDDTVGEKNNGVRPVYPPKITGNIAKNWELDDTKSFFNFSADIVIITNLDKVYDAALWSRLYKAPIFMTKQDIMEKIVETSAEVVKEFGATAEQGYAVADYMTMLVMSEQLDIDDEQVSYRVFKAGIGFIKEYPDHWQRKVNIGFGYQVRTSL